MEMQARVLGLGPVRVLQPEPVLVLPQHPAGHRGLDDGPPLVEGGRRPQGAPSPFEPDRGAPSRPHQPHGAVEGADPGAPRAPDVAQGPHSARPLVQRAAAQQEGRVVVFLFDHL